MERGQFYLISMTFAAITLTAMLFFIVFTESGPASAQPSVPNDFENILNAAQQRAAWVSNYWFNLNWSTKTIVTITAGIANPVQIDADITSGDCYNTVRVFNKTSSGFNEVPSNVSAGTAPCDVVFNAAVGTYEVYWNATPTPASPPTGRLTVASTGTAPTFTATVEREPVESICSHISNILAKKNIDLSCSGAEKENAFNYTVNFTSTDFNFDGTLP